MLRDQRAALGADGLIGVFRYLGAVKHRNPLVKQMGKAAHEARLGLAAFAEKDNVLAGQQGVHDLRDHRLIVALDAGKQVRATHVRAAQPFDQIAANFRLHGLGLVARRLQLT